MQVELSKGDKNLTVATFIGWNDWSVIPLHYVKLLVGCKLFGYKVVLATGAMSMGVAAMSACVVYCTDESVLKVFTKTIGVKQLRIREVSIVVCNCVSIWRSSHSYYYYYYY